MSTFSDRVYQEAFNIDYKWHKYLPNFVHKFHDLMYREYNTPVSLQMGTLLPFVASLCGPTTRGRWTTQSSVINFFTINVASSGCGKTQCRVHLISKPLDYMMENLKNESLPDMEVNKFTRAGIEDKIRSTGGYCILTTDEGTGFFKDLKNKESKHESDLSLMNQLYDGQGDKTTLAKEVERKVPKNSACLSVSIQQDGYITGIQSLGYSNWIDIGFSERFMITASRPYRHSEQIKHQASRELLDTYGSNFMGKLAMGLFKHHKDAKIEYALDEEAGKVYSQMVDKYNEQFNLKWSNSQEDATPLDSQERAEICVRSKATELIGRLSIILWIYTKAFECIHQGKPFHIPTKVTKDCVLHAEAVIRTSYSHSETFSSAAFSEGSKTSGNLSKPKTTDSNRTLMAVIKSPSCVVNLRIMQKNYLRNMTMPLIKDELRCLEEEGFGKLFLSEEQQMYGTSEQLGFNHQNLFFKPAPFYLDDKFITRLKDRDITSQFYLTVFRKEIDPALVPCVARFHPHVKDIDITQSQEVPAENKASMENLDGKVKSSLFGNKTGSKVKVPNSGSKGKGVKSSAKTSKKKPIIKPSTSKEVNDQTNPPNNPTSKVDQNQRRRAISPQFSQSSKQSNPKKINNNDEMDEEDENMSTGNNSADLFSSEQEENTGVSESSSCKRPMNTYVRTETKMSNTQKRHESVVVRQDQLTISNAKHEKESKLGPSQTGGYASQDWEDLLNDSSFGEQGSGNSGNITVKRKTTNTESVITEEKEQQKTEVKQRPVRAATKKYKFKPASKEKETDTSKASVSGSSACHKSNKEKRTNLRSQDINVIPETGSSNSDFMPDKNYNLAKRRRRLSRKQRDTKCSQSKLKQSDTNKK